MAAGEHGADRGVGEAVRQATAGDRSELARLRWRWRVDEEGERPLSSFEDFSTAFGRWLAAHEQTHPAFVAEVDGVVVGMTWLAVLDRIPGPGVWERRSGFLQALYVEPEHRGRGIGRALIDALLVDARARRLGYVSVHPSPRSFPLYRRAGFVDTGRVLQLRF